MSEPLAQAEPGTGEEATASTSGSASASEPRQYVLLMASPMAAPAKHWNEVKTVTASSPEAAIRQHLNAAGNGGTYVAVPARSWRPLSVQVETKREIKIGEAR